MEYIKAPVNIKVQLLQHVLDFLAIGKILLKPETAAIKAYPVCEMQGCYCFLERRHCIEITEGNVNKKTISEVGNKHKLLAKENGVKCALTETVNLVECIQ